MKFKSKIILIVVVIIAFFITVSLVFNIYSLKSRGDKDIADYRKTSEKKVKNNLKNYVQIAYTILQTNYNNAQDKEKLIKFYGERLKDYVNIVEQLINSKQVLVKSGKMSASEAQRQVLEQVSKIRYRGGKGYFWIITDEAPYPRMVLESAFPEYNGIRLDSTKFNNANSTSKNAFVACVEACDSVSEGFVDYSWPEPGTKRDSVDKEVFAFVKAYKDWNWIIGTHLYLEDAILEAAEKSLSDLRTITYDEGKGYFWINDDTRPTPRLLMNPTWLAGEGKIHTGKKLNVAFGKDWNLYEAFLEKSMEGDGNFVEYKWEKKTKYETKYDVPKQSYVKYFKELGWVVGSGVYIDDIDAEIDKKIAEMESVRNSMVVNYLIISFLVAGLALVALLYFMNKHFRKHGKIDDDTKTEQQKNDRLKQYEKDITPHANVALKKAALKAEDDKKQEAESVAEDATKIIKVFMAEQTKLLAFGKMLEQNKNDDATDDLARELHGLTQQLKASSSEIRELIEKMNPTHD